MPRLASVQLYPVKSLDPIEAPEARTGPNGGLECDRAWALFTVDGCRVNAKRTAAMHRTHAAYPPNLQTATLSAPGDRSTVGRSPAQSWHLRV